MSDAVRPLPGPGSATDHEGNGSENVHPDALFPDRDEIIAFHLANGATRSEAAKAAGCCLRVIYNRLADPAFKVRVGEFRWAMIDEAVGKLARVAGQAVDVLAEALQDDSAVIRVRAATTLLDALLRVRTHAELDERLAAIEDRAARERGRRR
jgi:hypothetical protein